MGKPYKVYENFLEESYFKELRFIYKSKFSMVL